MITKEYLHECFTIEPCGTKLRWKNRPREHFSCNRTFIQFNKECAGKLTANDKCSIGMAKFSISTLIKIMLGEKSIKETKLSINKEFDNKLASAWIAQRHYWRPIRMITWKKFNVLW